MMKEACAASCNVEVRQSQPPIECACVRACVCVRVCVCVCVRGCVLVSHLAFVVSLCGSAATYLHDAALATPSIRLVGLIAADIFVLAHPFSDFCLN